MNRYQYRYHLKKKFGISPEQYDELLRKQDSRCAICGAYEGDKSKRKLAVDHNHKTKEVRGLLCTKCNMGIGYLKDDVQILKNAIGYLER